jgi:DNA adenine methylase
MSNERSDATSRRADGPPLKWHIEGGKHYLASKIIALMPPHIHYVEPFFGGGAVLLAKNPEGVSEVANDRHLLLTNFWRVLRQPDDFAIFLRKCQATPFSEDAWKDANAMLCETDDFTDGFLATRRATFAWLFFVHCRQSLAGRMGTFAPLSRNRVRRGMNEQASAWLTAVEGLPAVHARLKRVVILNHDALDVIRQQDGDKTLFYLDPPYLHETRATTGEYQHEMTIEQHIELLDTLCWIKGKFLLSGYRSDLYDAKAQQYSWNRHDFDLPNNSAGGESKRRMTECVWCNF